MNRHSLSYENHILLGLFMISKPGQTLYSEYTQYLQDGKHINQPIRYCAICLFLLTYFK